MFTNSVPPPLFCPFCVPVGGFALAVSEGPGLTPCPVCVGVDCELGREDPLDELSLVPVVSTFLVFLIVPPTAPPTTAPMTMRTMAKMVMMPLRVRQKDVRGFVGAYTGEPSFSLEAVSGMAGVTGTGTGGTGGGWGDWGGGG